QLLALDVCLLDAFA
ncbi:DUF645 family protein, partial [Vibrio cholerae]|nr:DUF645 family protein [Vibrio cholerae]HDI3182426.1 DUF645 family protein [Vibrio cholerae]